MAARKLTKKPFHETVAERLIQQLKEGTAPWQKPWNPGDPSGFLPINPTTEKRYKGINALYLLSQGRSDPRWMTYKQAAAAGAQVLKGEKGIPVQYWKFTEQQTKLNDNGKPILDADGKPVKINVALERPRVFFATVFNAGQIDGLPPIERKPRDWDAIERAEHILSGSGASIQHAEANRAFYRSATDSIHLPDKSQFPSADNYYATALHELGHWTGHPSRLDRDLAHPFGSEGYAREELRAEIASMIVGDELGIGHDPGQHAAYVNSWIQALEDDPLEIFRAAADAEKIHAYVLAFEQKQVQEQYQQQAADTRLPHEMTLAEFIDQANVEALVNHGRKWNVALGNRYSSFSDAADTQAALADVHRGAVNNALYLNTPEGASVGSRPSLPPPVVLSEYPHLVSQYPHAIGQETNMHNLPSNDPDTREAETWTLHHIQQNSLDNALEAATLDQIDRVIETIDRMQPLNTQNDFWTDHELPYEVDSLDTKISSARDILIEQRRPDAVVAATFQNLKTGDPGSREHDRESFYKAADNALGFTLPHGWTGEVRITGVMNENGEFREANLVDETPDAYQLFARNASGSGEFTRLVTVEDQHTADLLADRFAIIDANSETDPYEKTAKLARLNEDKVRRDPNSTDDDISVAKETRKEAEMAAMLNDEDLQRSIAAHEQQQNQSTQQDKLVRTYIHVPYREKDEAKSLGARWDRQKQSWYVPPGVDAAIFTKWAQQPDQGAVQAPVQAEANKELAQDQKAAQARVYLAVPYGERGAAKVAGAQWDKAVKSWYAGPKADMDKLQRWLPENVQEQQGPAMSPREEFAEALKSLGCVVSGDHPIMDGKKHRIGVEGDKKGEQAGFYVGYLDGHPAGYIKNNRTGIDMKWKSKGYSLDPQEKAKLQAEAAEKLAARAAEQERQHEATAQRVSRQAESLVPVSEPTPYMQTKGIQPQAGALTDAEGQKTYIPATDADGKQWTMQYIQEDGTKRFAKDSRKEGCFHAVGGIEAVAAAPALVIAEGYATASTLAEALGHGTVAAFDSGNLPAVAQALHERFPDKPVVITGDDDRHLQATQGINPGKVKAQEAAKAVGGKAIFPVFVPGEAVYPAGLEPVTPQSYREHLRATKTLEEQPDLTDQAKDELRRSQLSDEQLAALNAMKRHTDFNDLDTKSELGREGVERQARAAVGKAVEGAERKREQQPIQQQEQKQRRAARIG